MKKIPIQENITTKIQQLGGGKGIYLPSSLLNHYPLEISEEILIEVVEIDGIKHLLMKKVI